MIFCNLEPLNFVGDSEINKELMSMCLYLSSKNFMLTIEATDEETYQTVKQLHPLKAPGSEGMHAMFYKK